LDNILRTYFIEVVTSYNHEGKGNFESMFHSEYCHDNKKGV